MQDRTFPKSVRLLRRSDFLRAQNSGQRGGSKFLLAFHKPNAVAKTRLGITVTTKIDKRSVVRNRIKRALREAFRINRKDILVGLDIVVCARPGIQDLATPEIQLELVTALKRIRALAG